MRLFVLLCVVAGTAPLLAAAQGTMYCMTGVPCGNGCTMGDGLCINGRCFDRAGQVEWECMAPMRAPGSFGPLRLNGHNAQRSWMQQQPPAQPRQQQQAQDADAVNFSPWQQQTPRFAPIWQPWGFPTFWRPMTWFAPPFAPAFAPMGPMFNNDCGGKGPCAKGQFCDTQGVCRADDCVSQFKYGCPDDKGELKKIACPHFSGFKECYTSTSDGFRCFKGPSGSSLACASQSNNAGGSVWSSSSGSSFQWPAWEDDNLPDADADAPAVDTKAPVAAPQPQPATKAAPVAKPAEPKPAAAGTKAEEATTPPTAASSSSSQQSSFKKVATEAGPAQAASAVAAGAATPVQKKQLVASGNRNLLAADQVGPGNMPPMARMGPLINPDGSTVMAAGPGPSIGMMDVDFNGGGMAAGTASGDQKTVVTRRGPDGMSSFSSSVSNNGGPAVASSVSGR